MSFLQVAFAKQALNMVAQGISALAPPPSTNSERVARFDTETFECSPAKLLKLAMKRRRELIERPSTELRIELLNKALIRCVCKAIGGDCSRTTRQRSSITRRRAARRRSRSATNKSKADEADETSTRPKRARIDADDDGDCERRFGASAPNKEFSSSPGRPLADYAQLRDEVRAVFSLVFRT